MLMLLVMMTLLLDNGFWLDQKHWRFIWLIVAATPLKMESKYDLFTEAESFSPLQDPWSSLFL